MPEKIQRVHDPYNEDDCIDSDEVEFHVNLGQIGFVFIEANVKKYSFGSVYGEIGIHLRTTAGKFEWIPYYKRERTYLQHTLRMKMRTRSLQGVVLCLHVRIHQTSDATATATAVAITTVHILSNAWHWKFRLYATGASTSNCGILRALVISLR